MAIVPLNSLVEPLHRDVICHSSSPPLGMSWPTPVGETRWSLFL